MEGRGSAVGQGLENPLRFRLVQDTGAPGGPVGTEPAVEGVHQGIVRQVKGRGPFAQVEPAQDLTVPGAAAFGEDGAVAPVPGLQVTGIGRHGREVPPEHPRIAILQIELPRHHTDGGSPGHATPAIRLPGRSIGHIARKGILCQADVFDPFLIEGGGVEAGHHHVHGNLAVAGVGEFLAVRAVAGRAAAQVVFLAPQPDGIDSVQQFFRAGERGIFFHRGTDFGEGNHVRGQPVHALDDGFARGVPHEAGLPGNGFVRGEHIPEGAVFLLGGEIHPQGVAGMSADAFEYRPAGMHRSEIHPPATVFQRFDANGRMGAVDGFGGAVHGAQNAVRGLSEGDLLPGLGRAAGVERLAQIEFVEGGGRRTDLPVPVGIADFGGAVPIGQFNAAQQARRSVGMHFLQVVVHVKETAAQHS